MTAVPSVTATEPASRVRRVGGPLLLGAAVLAGAAALHVRDPHQQGSWGVCPLYALTGIYCPGCGGLRAVNDLTQGNLWQAASSNVVLIALAPVAVFLYLRWVGDAWRGVRRPGDPRLQRNVSLAMGAVLVLFTVARNLPFGHWLAP
jgi:hypothetical protein